MSGTAVVQMLLRRLAPVAAFGVYGGWAFWVNLQNGSDRAVIAGSLQGTYAALSTLLLHLAVVALDYQFERRQFGKGATFGASVTVLTLLPAGLHWAAGSAEIVLSILPGVIIGSGYVVLILMSLRLPPTTTR